MWPNIIWKKAGHRWKPNDGRPYCHLSGLYPVESQQKIESTYKNDVLRELFTCQYYAIWVRAERSSKAEMQEAIQLVQMWGVSDGRWWWQMGEIAKDWCYLPTGYSEESGEEREARDNSAVLSQGHRGCWYHCLLWQNQDDSLTGGKILYYLFYMMVYSYGKVIISKSAFSIKNCSEN